MIAIGYAILRAFIAAGFITAGMIYLASSSDVRYMITRRRRYAVLSVLLLMVAVWVIRA